MTGDIWTWTLNKDQPQPPHPAEIGRSTVILNNFTEINIRAPSTNVLIYWHRWIVCIEWLSLSLPLLWSSCNNVCSNTSRPAVLSYCIVLNYKIINCPQFVWLIPTCSIDKSPKNISIKAWHQSLNLNSTLEEKLPQTLLKGVINSYQNILFIYFESRNHFDLMMCKW